MESATRMLSIEGGITAAEGFRVGAVGCGIKVDALDFALIVSDELASAAGVFTTNRAVAAPVVVCREHLATSQGVAQAIAVNSGCANACTGSAGMDAARAMADAVATTIGCPVEHTLIASTGVIGMPLPIENITHGITAAVGMLGRDNNLSAAEAIMTTDSGPKEYAVRVDLGSGSFVVGGMVKGAGMIEPMMATMLAFLTTDARVDPARLQRALVEANDDTFNAITVDGECSTNDSVFLLANGASHVVIDDDGYTAFVGALRKVSGYLAREIVRGGEGATKLVSVQVSGAVSQDDARRAARALANSPLVKTALNGGDPNWGRLVAVAGRAGVAFELTRSRVRIGPAVLYENDTVHDDREPKAAEHLCGSEVEIEVDLGTGGSDTARVWTCDFSADYVRINADYRT